MFLDACHHAVGQFQRTAAGGTIHARRTARAHRVHKRAQLGAQRLFRNRGHLFKIDFGGFRAARLRLTRARAANPAA